MEQHILDELKNQGAHIVETTRTEVRNWIDGMTNQVDEELSTAMDNGQGEADAPTKTAYVLIQIRGETL